MRGAPGARRLPYLFPGVVVLSLLSACSSLVGSTSTMAGRPAARTPLEQTEALLACIQDRGVAVTLDTTLRNQPGIQYDNRVVDSTEYQQAADGCRAELTEQGVLPPAPVVDRAFLEGFYADLLDTRECLEREGYTTSEPPSLDAFIEAEGRNWHPYNDVSAVGPEDLDRLLGVCPQP